MVGNHFIIQIDHHSLKYFLEGRAHTPFQQKWAVKLLGFDYEILYEQGCDNQVANALARMPYTSKDPSCHPLSASEISVISYPYSSWLDELRRDIEKDTWVVASKFFILLMMHLLVLLDFILTMVF